jgi:alanine dehydrogenase
VSPSFGFVREVLLRERRVAITPAGIEQLAAAGLTVLIEAGAGTGANFTDADFMAAGADIRLSAAEVAADSDVLVKLHSPTAEEADLLKSGGALMGFLQLWAPDKAHLRRVLRERKVTAIAHELIECSDGARPILETVSAIGGRVAVILAVRHMLVSGGGIGRLLGGSPGVPPLEVVVLGAGAAGQAAAREAQRMGGRVTVLDRDPRKLTRLANDLDGISTVVASGHHLDAALSGADLVICAVAIAGRPAPKIVTRRHLRTMGPGAMLIDMSIDEGGCAESSRPTSPDEPIYEVDGVRHMCVPNLPAEVARTASHAFTNAVLPYLLSIGELGTATAVAEIADLGRGCVYRHGVLENSVVAELTGEPLG